MTDVIFVFLAVLAFTFCHIPEILAWICFKGNIKVAYREIALDFIKRYGPLERRHREYVKDKIITNMCSTIFMFGVGFMGVRGEYVGMVSGLICFFSMVKYGRVRREIFEVSIVLNPL